MPEFRGSELRKSGKTRLGVKPGNDSRKVHHSIVFTSP